jgi:hypothetical protein
MFCAEPIYESQWSEHLIVSVSLSATCENEGKHSAKRPILTICPLR